jgi:hypothetical protein
VLPPGREKNQPTSYAQLKNLPAGQPGSIDTCLIEARKRFNKAGKRPVDVNFRGMPRVETGGTSSMATT